MTDDDDLSLAGKIASIIDTHFEVLAERSAPKQTRRQHLGETTEWAVKELKELLDKCAATATACELVDAFAEAEEQVGDDLFTIKKKAEWDRAQRDVQRSADQLFEALLRISTPARGVMNCAAAMSSSSAWKGAGGIICAGTRATAKC